MKRIRAFLLSICSLILLAPAAFAAPETFVIDGAHTNVGFSVRHMFSDVTGRFNDFSGTIELDAEAKKIISVKGEVKTASVDTRHEKRDNHLRDEDFFNVKKFPTMTFTSTDIKGKGEKIRITGDFTMLGVTRPVTFQAKYLGVGSDPWGNRKAGFSATVTIDRRDFGMGYNAALDTGGLVLGHEVTITLDIEAGKPKPQGE